MQNHLKGESFTSSLFNSLQLLKAYEQAIDENIISSITDTKGIIVHANSKFCEVSQYSADELIGQSHSFINSHHHSKEFFKTMWQAIGNGNIWHDEIRNKAKDGTFYWVDTVIVPIKNESGKNTHYLSLRSLITERKQLEKKKERYVSSLEVLLVMTSSNIKKPLLRCLEQINSFDPERPSGKDELRQIVGNLKSSAVELDNFTKELTIFIRDIE